MLEIPTESFKGAVLREPILASFVFPHHVCKFTMPRVLNIPGSGGEAAFVSEDAGRGVLIIYDRPGFEVGHPALWGSPQEPSLPEMVKDKPSYLGGLMFVNHSTEPRGPWYEHAGLNLGAVNKTEDFVVHQPNEDQYNERRAEILQRAEKAYAKWLGRFEHLCCGDVVQVNYARNIPNTAPTKGFESTERETFRDSLRRGTYTSELSFDYEPAVRKKNIQSEGGRFIGPHIGPHERKKNIQSEGGRFIRSHGFEVQELPDNDEWAAEDAKLFEEMMNRSREQAACLRDEAIKASVQRIADLRKVSGAKADFELLQDGGTFSRLTDVHSCAHLRKKRLVKGRVVEIKRHLQRYVLGMLPDATREEILMGDQMIRAARKVAGEKQYPAETPGVKFKRKDAKQPFEGSGVHVSGENAIRRFSDNTYPPWVERERKKLVHEYKSLIRGLTKKEAALVLATQPDWESDAKRVQLLSTSNNFTEFVDSVGENYEKFMWQKRKEELHMKKIESSEIPDFDQVLNRIGHEEVHRLFDPGGWFAIVTLNNCPEAKYLGPLVDGDDAGNHAPDVVEKAFLGHWKTSERQAVAYAKRTNSSVRAAKARVSQAYDISAFYRHRPCKIHAPKR